MSGSVQYAIGSKNVLKICIDGDQSQMEIRKTSSRRPRSVDNAEIGHFTLLGGLKVLANEDTLLRTRCCRHKCFPVCSREQYLLRTQILCPGHKNVSVFVQKHFVSASNVFQFARARKRHEQQCFRNNVSSFATALSKPRRRRQRERHQRKGLMSRTMATHVRYKSLYISLPSPAKQQREMIKFCVLYRTRTTTANFCISIWNYKPPLHI